MGKVYNTTNTIDNSIFLKSKLSKNMVGDNYYIENLQDKRNADWEYRYNVVEIEEELEKQIEYTTDEPNYTPIEAVITNVKPIKGEELGTDFAQLAFKNLKHKGTLGYRYRFSLDFPDMKNMSYEEKHYNTSIWICINKTPITAGNGIVVRRCNTALNLLGSPTGSSDYITEIHSEPAILSTQLKYMQIFYNMATPVPQSEWYATLQLNYFTNQIKINDRFIFGTIDKENRENNQVYKVKAVIKSTADHTFIRNSEDELKSTPLITIALDKDMISPDDDLENGVANGAPIYKTIEVKPVYNYYIQMDENNTYTAPQRLLLNERGRYCVNVYYNGVKVENPVFTFEHKINNKAITHYENYYDFTYTDNTFTIKNKKQCNRGCVVVKASWTTPDSNTISESYEIELGGFY